MVDRPAAESGRREGEGESRGARAREIRRRGFLSLSKISEARDTRILS